MKDPSDEILTAFYTALNGNLSYGGNNFPVYTSAPRSTDYRYVHLAGLNLTDDSAKDMFISDCALIIEIVDDVYKIRGTFKGVNDISNDILQLIIKTRLSMTNFTMTVTPWLEDADYFMDNVDIGQLPRKALIVRFGVQQN